MPCVTKAVCVIELAIAVGEQLSFRCDGSAELRSWRVLQINIEDDG
jgi:hypothetical protein